MTKLSNEDVERIKEEKRGVIREEIRRKGFSIGVVVVKNNHLNDCRCDDCLTNPGPFCPFPEEHKNFVDVLFALLSNDRF